MNKEILNSEILSVKNKKNLDHSCLRVNFNTPVFICLLLLPLLLFSSCGKEAFFDEMVEIPDHSWTHSDMIQFKVDVKDTVNTFDFFVNIRHTKSYGYSNLFIFLHTIAPDGRQMTDTLEFPMADPEGNYVGKVSGGLVLNRIIVKKETRFPKSGEYKFVIEQAMRDKKLEEITDVGLTIVKTSN